MEKPSINDDEVYITVSDDGDNNIMKDPLLLPGILKKAKEHGSAQRVLRIPEEYSAESKINK